MKAFSKHALEADILRFQKYILLSFLNHGINKTICFCLLGCHIVISFRILNDFLVWLTSILCKNSV